MRIHVFLLCCVQIKFYPMTKSTVFLFLPSVAPVPRIERHYKQMLHEDVRSTFVHMGPSGKKDELNYMTFLLIGFTGSFSKPLCLVKTFSLEEKEIICL